MSSSKVKIRIGILVKEEKFASLKLDQLVSLSNSEIDIVKIDSSKPLEQQGKFDVILSKITDKIVSKNEKDKEFLESFRTFLKKYPSCVPVDSIEAQEATLDRDAMGRLFKEAELKLKDEMKVHNPRHLFVQTSAPIYDLKGIQFPVVCKSNVAGGSSAAHKMGIVFNEKGLHQFTPPFVAQEFYNHNNVIFKVFVIGDTYQVVKRKSLPNLPENLTETIFFDSQHPILPQLQQVGINIDEGKNQDTPDVPAETMKAMMESLRDTFGVSIFGFDVITNAKTGKHGIIDINYFPGFIGVDNFSSILLNHLVSKNKKTTK